MRISPPDALPSAAVTLAVSDDGADVRLITHADLAPGAWAIWRIACNGTVSDGRTFSVPPDDPVGPPGFETARLVNETLVHRTARGLAHVDLAVEGARPTLAVNLETQHLTHCLLLPSGDLVCGDIGAEGTSIVRIDADGAASARTPAAPPCSTARGACCSSRASRATSRGR